MLCNWINPQNLVVIGGRGLAKSTEIQAERTIAAAYDMPGAPMAIIADTYTNLDSKILRAIREGWKRKGKYEGIHYVCNQRPPEEWLKKCSVVVHDFKNTIFWHNGTVFFCGSLDRPSLLAGLSVVHLFTDEAKYQSDKKINNVLPTLRGDAITYGHSVFFMGITATTDMPDVNEGEYGWVFSYADQMDPERIMLILQLYDLLNKVRLKIFRESQKSKPNQKRLEKLYKEENKWEQGWKKARYRQTFFINASSLINIDILTVDYLTRQYSTDMEAFKKSVLGMRPTLGKDARFYSLLGEHHFYYDGFDEYYYGSDGITESSRGLKYLHHNKAIDIGMDFGNMISMLVGQEDGDSYRIHKEFYELTPKWIRAVADQFLDYFKDHERKEINIFYDRSANNFQKQGQDLAGQLREALEKHSSGVRTGWTVELKSRKQGNIGQATEYYFAMDMMRGDNEKLPKLLIDANNCKCLKSSMEKAPRKVKENAKGIKVVVKVKTSEKLPLRLLPLFSTNFSDAFKYLVCRREWLKLSRPRRRNGETIGDS